MNTESNLDGPSVVPSRVRSVPMYEPFTWLSMGWDDLLHHRGASLGYGVLVSVLGALILGFGRHPYFLAASISGFLLVGPIMTGGTCELSREREKGEVADFDHSLDALKRDRTGLLRFSVVLMLLSIVWFGLSSVILYLAHGSVAPELGDTMWGDVLVNLSMTQIMSYLVIGGSLAFLVLALSVVSVPMIIDRDADALVAIRTSLRVTLTDLPAVFMWGIMIVILIGIGFATFLIGMIVIFPLLGHATWYAYRDLVPVAGKFQDGGGA